MQMSVELQLYTHVSFMTDIGKFLMSSYNSHISGISGIWEYHVNFWNMFLHIFNFSKQMLKFNHKNISEVIFSSNNGKESFIFCDSAIWHEKNRNLEALLWEIKLRQSSWEVSTFISFIINFICFLCVTVCVLRACVCATVHLWLPEYRFARSPCGFWKVK